MEDGRNEWASVEALKITILLDGRLGKFHHYTSLSLNMAPTCLGSLILLYGRSTHLAICWSSKPTVRLYV